MKPIWAATAVTTQAELDSALTNPDHACATHEIIIDSPAGVWLTVGDDHGQDVRACGLSSVRAFGSSSVIASDSASVRAYGSASVRAYGSASVTAYGSATVTAHGSATVTAHGSATVTAHGSATVTATGSATVTAYGSSSVTASTCVAVHLHSARVTHTGGVIIDCTTIDETDPATWGDYHGATVEDGIVTLYKCLPQDLTSGRAWGKDTVWPTSGDITCDDFEPTDECGHGLHVSPSPSHAWAHLESEVRPRFLEVTASLDDIVPITGGTAKCKVKSCTVVREVDVMGRPVTSEVVES